MTIEIPGHTIELREGMVYVNGVPHPKVSATPKGAFDLSQTIRSGERWRPADPIKDVGKRARFWDWGEDLHDKYEGTLTGAGFLDEDGAAWRNAEVIDTP